MPKPQTNRSTPRLSEVAKFVHVPPGAVTTGWPAVRDKLADLGIRFRWWQVAIAMIVLSKNAGGKYTTTIGGTGLSIPRQVGKTFLVGALVFALCLLRPGLTVVWSAHRLRTAEETFKKMQGFARRKAIKPHVLKVTLGSGEESIEFANGSRIMFGARAAGFGRGFDEVDVVVYDEAQILDQSALDDMIPATNQCRQPEGALMFFMGTPPQKKDIDSGRAEVFTLMRESAKQGDEDTAWIEFGADDGYEPTPLPAPLTERDWKQIAKANPSFPEDTPRESILRMRKKLGDASFKLEGAGVWNELEKVLAVIPDSVWSGLETDGPPDGIAPASIAIDASHDGVLVAAGCWRFDDASHVELLALDNWSDDDVAADWIACRAKRRIPVVIDQASPANRLIPLLKARGCKVIAGHAGDMSKACGGIYSAALTPGGGRLSWGGPGSHLIGKALEGATKRKIGDAGGWGWDRRDPETNIAPLVAVTLAHYGASMTKQATGRGRTAGGRRAVAV